MLVLCRDWLWPATCTFRFLLLQALAFTVQGVSSAPECRGCFIPFLPVVLYCRTRFLTWSRLSCPPASSICFPLCRCTAVLQDTVSHMVKTVMSTSFIVAFSSVVFNLKSRFCKEKAWEVRARGREEGGAAGGSQAMGGARRGSEWAGFWWQRDVGAYSALGMSAVEYLRVEDGCWS